MPSSAGGLHLVDSLGNVDRALGHTEVKPLHHAPLHDNHALLGVLRLPEGGDDLTGPVHLLLSGREDFVAGRNLAWVDERLAVHAKRAAVLALLAQAELVAKVVIDAVEDVEVISPGGDNGHGEPRHNSEAIMQSAGARLLEQVVSSHDEATEAILCIDSRGRDGARVQNCHGRLTTFATSSACARSANTAARLAWTARRSSTQARLRPATKSSRPLRRRWTGPVRSSPPSGSRRTPRKASLSWRGAWWSGFTSVWPSARSTLPRLSTRWRPPALEGMLEAIASSTMRWSASTKGRNQRHGETLL